MAYRLYVTDLDLSWADFTRQKTGPAPDTPRTATFNPMQTRVVQPILARQTRRVQEKIWLQATITHPNVERVNAPDADLQPRQA